MRHHSGCGVKARLREEVAGLPCGSDGSAAPGARTDGKARSPVGGCRGALHAACRSGTELIMADTPSITTGRRVEGDPPLFFAAHVFVCCNRRPDGHRRGSCAARGSEDLRDYMKVRAKELGLPEGPGQPGRVPGPVRVRPGDGDLPGGRLVPAADAGGCGRDPAGPSRRGWPCRPPDAARRGSLGWRMGTRPGSAAVAKRRSGVSRGTPSPASPSPPLRSP